MLRKVLCGLIIAISAFLLVLSIVGIGAAWAYNEPVTQRALAQLHDLDGELAQAQSAFDGAETELRRALRILESAQTALQTLSQSTAQVQHTLKGVGEALDNSVVPGLRSASQNSRPGQRSAARRHQYAGGHQLDVPRPRPHPRRGMALGAAAGDGLPELSDRQC